MKNVESVYLDCLSPYADSEGLSNLNFTIERVKRMNNIRVFINCFKEGLSHNPLTDKKEIEEAEEVVSVMDRIEGNPDASDSLVEDVWKKMRDIAVSEHGIHIEVISL
jgi:hypothetical protein